LTENKASAFKWRQIIVHQPCGEFVNRVTLSFTANAYIEGNRQLHFVEIFRISMSSATSGKNFV